MNSYKSFFSHSNQQVDKYEKLYNHYKCQHNNHMVVLELKKEQIED